jgi:transcriptional regulator with XRE-family HTH domain
MVWDGDRIRDLRRRLGLTQSDLARRLEIESYKIGEMEIGLIEETPLNVSSRLDLLFKQAEASADGVSCDSLAEILFEEDSVLQVDTTSIHRKFLDQ